MRTRKTLLALVAASALAAGCAQQPTNEDVGTVVGGVLGGAAGSQIGGDEEAQTIGTIVGAIAGAAIGGAVGRSMDQTDRLQAARTLETVPTGQTTSWVNNDSGYEYRMTPTETYTSGSQPCREFRMQASIEGDYETVRGTACRLPDGTWEIQS